MLRRRACWHLAMMTIVLAEQAEEFISIWEEFEEGITDDAKFAKSMDRFEPLLQNTSNNGGIK